MSQSVIIIGAGQAAAQASISLRSFGYDGSLTIIGDEPFIPYQRPPLSKAYMKGDMSEERLYFKPSSWYQDQSIDLILSDTVTQLDTKTKTVRLKRGRELNYDKLILATGARPRPMTIPGADLGNVFYLRTLSDVKNIRPHMTHETKLVIVGAGYIGLEAAAVAQTLGLNVTVLEMADRVLARVAGSTTSDFYETTHREHGVDIRTGAQVAALRGDHDVTHVQLSDGNLIEANIVLIGIGILPNKELAQEAGITCAEGVVTDRDSRTSDPDVFAAGDCAQRPIIYLDRSGRLESVHNAIEQGKLAAAAITGNSRPIEDCPWFWSDQFDYKLQIAGLSNGFDTEVLRGYPQDGKFSVFYFKQERLIAVDAINSPPEFIVSKKLISAGACPSPELLADTTKSMKEIAATIALGDTRN
ncbi:MAG: FAD-dependent oxidoreductase [Henriciella sp.]